MKISESIEELKAILESQGDLQLVGDDADMGVIYQINHFKVFHDLRVGYTKDTFDIQTPFVLGIVQ